MYFEVLIAGLVLLVVVSGIVWVTSHKRKPLDEKGEFDLSSLEPLAKIEDETLRNAALSDWLTRDHRKK